MHSEAIPPSDAEIKRLVSEVFETSEDGSWWMEQPHQMLRGKSPAQAITTPEGAQQVLSMLVAIKYGGVL